MIQDRTKPELQKESQKYQCTVCGETFASSVPCGIHHLDTRHEDFQVVGTENKITINSSDDAKKVVGAMRISKDYKIMQLGRLI